MTTEIINYIKEHNLDSPRRHREYSYKRSYLAYLLHKQGMTLQQIADVFNRTHATIMHCITLHKHFMTQNDTIYLFHIKTEIDYFQPMVEIKRDIFNEILNAYNTTDLTRIKERILNNEYLLVS
jgi:transcription initiation factor TFIIIB Brf1 subunit/transcription initiation factor TFIIB